MQLKKFQRVFIPKGETREVSFALNADDLSIVNADMKRVVEPGDFTIMIGSSSDNIILQQTITVEWKSYLFYLFTFLPFYLWRHSRQWIMSILL